MLLSLTEIAIIADRKFHFIRAVKFSRHAYAMIGQLAMTGKFAASTETGQNKVCLVYRDLCICLQCVSVQCERVRVHPREVWLPSR